MRIAARHRHGRRYHRLQTREGRSPDDGGVAHGRQRCRPRMASPRGRPSPDRHLRRRGRLRRDRLRLHQWRASARRPPTSRRGQPLRQDSDPGRQSARHVQGPPPSLTVCNTDSLGEQVQREFPDTRVGDEGTSDPTVVGPDTTAQAPARPRPPGTILTSERRCPAGMAAKTPQRSRSDAGQPIRGPNCTGRRRASHPQSISRGLLRLVVEPETSRVTVDRSPRPTITLLKGHFT
jgi:hypothetical protein